MRVIANHLRSEVILFNQFFQIRQNIFVICLDSSQCIGRCHEFLFNPHIIRNFVCLDVFVHPARRNERMCLDEIPLFSIFSHERNDDSDWCEVSTGWKVNSHIALWPSEIFQCLEDCEAFPLLDVLDILVIWPLNPLIQLFHKKISQILATHVFCGSCNRNHILKCILVECENRVCFYPVLRFPHVIIFIHLCDIYELCIVLEYAFQKIAAVFV